jgi:hypothetical protein
MVNILKHGVDGTVITEWRMVWSVEVSVVVIQLYFAFFRVNAVEERMLTGLVNKLGRDLGRNNLSLLLALLLPQLLLQLVILHHYVN